MESYQRFPNLRGNFITPSKPQKNDYVRYKIMTVVEIVEFFVENKLDTYYDLAFHKKL